MKKYIFLSLFSVVILLGCEDFIDLEPQDQLTTTAFYKTAADAISATNAAYDGFQHLNYYGFNYPDILNIAGGDAVKGGFGAGDRPAYLEFETFNITDNNLRIGEFYAMAWGGVNRANQVLDNVSQMEVGGDFTEELKTRLLGEATFLRALHYMNLVLGFGGMPIYTSVPAIDDEVLPRATAEETWAFIIQDFNDAADMLPDTYDAENVGRATRGAANAMLARVHSLRGEWTQVKTHADLVIESPAGYDLAPTFAENFDERGNNNVESIFEIQYTLSNTSLDIWSSAGDWNSNFIAKYSAPQVGNAGWATMSPTQELVDDFEAGDIRLGETVYQPGDPYPNPNGDGTFDPFDGSHFENAGLFGHKKLTGLDFNNSAGNGFNYNYKIIRFADILLLKAEAENELNGVSADALNPLNRIRSRAGLPPVNETNNPGLSQDQLRDIILDERRSELAMEGLRFYDVVYRGRGTEFLGARGYQPGDEIFPIPPSEIAQTGWPQN
ncbi:RagB/SusD family nutrient uptake outer membrane protein [Maribacter algicola]|uniref:RagB/SusD family nutrient uptake outer membrane protein n=1 Tax=Maribacter algicola TaxID=2498892 RepID=A0A3R8PX89_9FLAO|nr:RagB/SusD family nutrient uptake outer membrane protein [Maribacter algicola]RRQ48013.1 RagB/SusD family nutrient uptake outer membrane protein [Maribacter algicola]